MSITKETSNLDHLVVKSSLLVPRERGLFTTEEINKGDVVLMMSHATKINRKQTNELLRQLKTEERVHDIMIHYNSSTFYDSQLRENGFTGNQYSAEDDSKWYYMNHKKDANVKLILYKGSPAWKAISCISMNSELFYDYGEPDSAWVA